MRLQCRALLFDLDGVLIDSRGVTERHWRRWADRHSIGWEALRAGMHGVPTRQVVTRFAPHLDVAAEAARLEAEQAEDTSGIGPMRGAAELLDSLPGGAWAVVTSGTRPLALARLAAAGLPLPVILVSADDVSRGKPDPEPYLLAAERLGVAPAHAVVVEDSAPGAAAGKAGGFRVIGVGEHLLPQADLQVPGVWAITAAVEGAGAASGLDLRLSPSGPLASSVPAPPPDPCTSG